MSEQEFFLLIVAVSCGVWALAATGACIWYQAEREYGRNILMEIRKFNQTLDDLMTVEQAQGVLSRILSGRRA